MTAAAAATRRTLRGRPRRQCLRADVESRARLRRLAAGSRPASEQHARRGRPRSRAARAGRPDGEHDGPRRSSLTALSSSRWAPQAARVCAPRSSACSRACSMTVSSRRRRSTGRASIPPATVNAEPGVDDAWLRQLETAGRAVGAGPGATTTSAASARPGAGAQARTRAGAAWRCRPARDARRIQPRYPQRGQPDSRAPCRRRPAAVARAAVEAAHALDVDHVPGGVHVSERRRNQGISCGLPRPGRRRGSPRRPGRSGR